MNSFDPKTIQKFSFLNIITISMIILNFKICLNGQDDSLNDLQTNRPAQYNFIICNMRYYYYSLILYIILFTINQKDWAHIIMKFMIVLNLIIIYKTYSRQSIVYDLDFQLQKVEYGSLIIIMNWMYFFRLLTIKILLFFCFVGILWGCCLLIILVLLC
jgi:hypothetical protein